MKKLVIELSLVGFKGIPLFIPLWPLNIEQW